jgi:hypothetical protein
MAPMCITCRVCVAHVCCNHAPHSSGGTTIFKRLGCQVLLMPSEMCSSVCVRVAQVCFNAVPENNNGAIAFNQLGAQVLFIRVVVVHNRNTALFI